MKKYNLALPEEVFDAIQEQADKRNTSVAHLIRQFIKAGMLVANCEDNPGMSMIIRDARGEREIMLL